MLPTDQGHLRKYLATLGVAVVAGVISVSALALRLQESLLISEADLRNLTPLARETVERRQHFTEVVTTLLPWFFFLGIATGAAVTAYGIRGWSKRQKVADDIEDTTRDRARYELREMTKSELEERRDEEARAAAPTADAIARRLTRAQVVRLEELLIGKLRELFGEVQTNVRLLGLGTTHAVDAVAIDARGTNHVFEMKYAASTKNLAHRLVEARAQVAEFVSVIGLGEALGVEGYVIAVVPDAFVEGAQRMAAARAEAFAPIRLLVVGETEFEALSADELGERLAIGGS